MTPAMSDLPALPPPSSLLLLVRLRLVVCVGLVAMAASGGVAGAQGDTPPTAAQGAAQGAAPTTSQRETQGDPPQGDALVVTAEATFLRDTPGTRGRVLGRLEQGAAVDVLDRSAGDWWRVRGGSPPREGYVHRLVLGPSSRTRPRLPPPVALPRPDDTAPPVVEPAVDVPADRAPRGTTGPGLLLFAGAGVFVPLARESFDAVGITGNPVAFSGGLEVTRIIRGLFARASVDWISETGERVFIGDAGERFGLGIPLDVTMTPIDVTAGWRFEYRDRRGRPGRLVPFVGGGAGILRYRETDPFADEADEVDERFASYHLLGGADVAISRWVGVRFEYRFRAVPDAIGSGGVSAVTGDSSLGGSTVTVGVVLGR